MVNVASRAPFWEEMLKGFCTTLPRAGRAGQSCAAAEREQQIPSIMTAGRHPVSNCISISSNRKKPQAHRQVGEILEGS